MSTPNETSPRYVVEDGSRSGHCCFDATVVDTTEDTAACECFTRAAAERIATALNAGSPRDTGSDALLTWARAHGLHRDLDEHGSLTLVSTTVGAERRSIARERDPDSPYFGRFHFARIVIDTTETLEHRWIDADPIAWSAAMGII
jgi:hypothetical protein